MKIRRPSRRAVATLGALAFGLSLSGCGYLETAQTHYFYQSAEGSVLNFTPEGPSHSVGVRNLLAVESGGTVKLTGTAVNHGSKDYTLDISVAEGGSGNVSVNVPAGKTIKIGDGKGADITSKVKPGDNIVVNVTLDGETRPLTVQLLDDSLEYLEHEETTSK